MSTNSNKSSDENSYDVAIIGGGPGGAALATFLAKKGRRCFIAEASEFPRYHIGESLVPHTYGILERLGLLSKLKQSTFPEKHSVRFVAPNGHETTPFYFSETIPGDGARTWQVERGEFDQLMLDHAREHKVEIREGAQVNKVLFDNGRATGLEIVNGSGPETICARVVVDASGRATVMGRQLGLKTDVPGLNKSSLWGYYRGGKRLPGIDAGETTLLRLENGGWFWYIPLPDDMVSVGVVADPEDLSVSGETSETIFDRMIADCPALVERLKNAERVGKLHGLRKLAYLNKQTCGDGWVMIGDARAFLDPIYSSGLFLALGSAELAANCIEDALGNNDVSATRLGAFEPLLTDAVNTVRCLIHAFYDPGFSFKVFLERFPEQRRSLIDCLVGDVVKDMSPFTEALAVMTQPPPSLSEGVST